jgi:hypothetical protein
MIGKSILLAVVVFFGSLALAEGQVYGERLPSKQEMDRLFSLTKSQWEVQASSFLLQGYTMRYFKHDTGVQVIGYERATSFGFSIQPLYANATDPPLMITIGNYFPAGQYPSLTEATKVDITEKAQKQLEGAYVVRVGAPKWGNVEGIEMIISKP